MDNYFAKLNAVNVRDKTEKKNGLTYLSWAWAWGEVKKLHPDATYTIYENADGWFYHTDGKTCWVKTGVTVQGIEHIEYLPVMDFRNASISADKVTSFDVNKAIQRSLTKACARHGLGLYIYAGEDLPEGAPKQPTVDKHELKLTRKGLIARDVQKYIGTKDKVKTREGIDAAEAFMRVNKTYDGLPYENLSPEQFADYLLNLNAYYQMADDAEVTA